MNKKNYLFLQIYGIIPLMFDLKHEHKERYWNIYISSNAFFVKKNDSTYFVHLTSLKRNFFFCIEVKKKLTFTFYIDFYSYNCFFRNMRLISKELDNNIWIRSIS